MLFRVSAKFKRQYSCQLEKGELPVRAFPQTWNIDLLNHSRQLLAIASEEYSLFSVLIPLSRERKIESFLRPCQKRLFQLFENLGMWRPPDLTQISFSVRTDRRIIGSQNDFIHMTRAHLHYAKDSLSSEDLLQIEKSVNRSPMSYLGMDS